MPPSDSVQIQSAHYDRIADEYALHYGDAYSQQYRIQFINRPLFEGLNLKGTETLEAMCGSGETTGYLLQEGAHVTGLDVSEREIAKFKNRWGDASAVCASMLESGLPSESFDLLVVVGGLHHLHPDLDAALIEMHRLLKPGGTLCFAEPHAGSFPDTLRKIWYKHDHLFAKNEAAIDLNGLKTRFADRFTFKKEIYCGGIAYLLVLNSMAFRIPLALKKIYSPFLLWLESKMAKFQGARNSCLVLGQWERR